MKKTICNFLTSIKNAQISKKSIVIIKKSKQAELFLKILWLENFILGYKTFKNKNIKVFLKYFNNTPLINFFKFTSKKTKNIYFSKEKIWKINKTNNFYIFSTNLGLKSLANCKKKDVGGKLILVLR